MGKNQGGGSKTTWKLLSAKKWFFPDGKENSPYFGGPLLHSHLMLILHFGATIPRQSKQKFLKFQNFEKFLSKTHTKEASLRHDL